MKSRITIEVDFDQNSPFIKVLEQDSDDVRDGLIKAFRQKFGYQSMWARIEFREANELGKALMIYPIADDRLVKEAETMLKLSKLEEVDIDDII